MEIEKKERGRFTTRNDEEIENNLELNYQRKMQMRERAREL